MIVPSSITQPEFTGAQVYLIDLFDSSDSPVLLSNLGASQAGPESPSRLHLTPDGGAATYAVEYINGMQGWWNDIDGDTNPATQLAPDSLFDMQWADDDRRVLVSGWQNSQAQLSVLDFGEDGLAQMAVDLDGMNPSVFATWIDGAGDWLVVGENVAGGASVYVVDIRGAEPGPPVAIVGGVFNWNSVAFNMLPTPDAAWLFINSNMQYSLVDLNQLSQSPVEIDGFVPTHMPTLMLP